MSYAKRIRLTDAIRDKLAVELSRIRIDGEFGPEHGELARSVIEEYAGAEALEAIYASFDPSDAPPLSVIENGPISRDVAEIAGPSPRDNRRPAWRTEWVEELFMGGVLQAAGMKIHALQDEYGGDLTHYLFSNAKQLTSVPTRTSRSELKPHSDNSVLLCFQPQAVALYGLRRENPIATKFYDVEDLARAIGPYHLDSLMKSIFQLRDPVSFHLDGSPQVFSPPVPALYRDRRGRILGCFSVYNHRAVPGFETEATEAVEALIRAASRPELVLEADLAPGTLALVDNQRTFHSRDDIMGDRIILRQYGMRSLAGHAATGASVSGRPNRYYGKVLMEAGWRHVATSETARA